MQIWKHVIGHEVLFRWDVIGWTLAALLGLGAILMPYNGYAGAKICAIIGALVLLAKIVEIAATSPDPFLTRVVFVSILFVVIGFALVQTLRWVDSKRPTMEPPFAIAIEDTVQKIRRGALAGPFAAAIPCQLPILASIDYMPIIRITNKQPVESSIKSYSMDLLDQSGKWNTLRKIQLLPTEPNLYFMHAAGYLTDLTPDQSLDLNLSGKTLAPGQSVSGWTYFAYPARFSGLEEGSHIHARVRVVDFAGHSYTAEITDSERGPDPNQVPSGHGFRFGSVRLNIADHSFANITDCRP